MFLADWKGSLNLELNDRQCSIPQLSMSISGGTIHLSIWQGREVRVCRRWGHGSARMHSLNLSYSEFSWQNFPGPFWLLVSMHWGEMRGLMLAIHFWSFDIENHWSNCNKFKVKREEQSNSPGWHCGKYWTGDQTILYIPRDEYNRGICIQYNNMMSKFLFKQKIHKFDPYNTKPTRSWVS